MVSAEVGKEFKIQGQNIENIWLATVSTLHWEGCSENISAEGKMT